MRRKPEITPVTASSYWVDGFLVTVVSTEHGATSYCPCPDRPCAHAMAAMATFKGLPA